MAGDQVWHSTDVPADFPTRDEIVNLCSPNRNGVCVRVAGKPRYWVKGEGCTHAYVAGIVNVDPANVVRVPAVHLGFSRGWRGYIVMDFVQGTTLAKRKSLEGNYSKDINAVAAAVKQITDIKMPVGTAPGPIGGGLIGRDFFVACWRSSISRPGISRHILLNEVLRHLGNGLCVDLQTETVDGLVLCLPDPNDSNFMIDGKGKLWAIDFGRSVARCVKYPSFANLSAMSVASGQLVIYNNNALRAAFIRPPPGAIERGDERIPSEV